MIVLYILGGVILGAGIFALGVWYGHQLGHVKGQLLEAESLKRTEFFRESGYVTVDCRSCEQVNRITWQRLRDKPVCGKCKARLMPKTRITVTTSDPVLNHELSKVWNDFDKTWSLIADAFDRLSMITPLKDRAKSKSVN